MEINLGEKDFFPGIHSKKRDLFASNFDRITNPERSSKMLRGRGRGSYHSSSRLPRRSIEDGIAFSFEKPEYSDEITTKVKPIDIRKHEKLNILPLLSMDHLVRFDNGVELIVDDVETRLNGKYVLVCCFYVPIKLHGFGVSQILNLSLLSKELYETHKHEFEMVIVVKLRPGWAHDKDVFKHFVSGFSPSCLVVPFEQSTRVDFICRVLNLEIVRSGVLVGPDGVVIQDSLDKLVYWAGKYIFPYSDQTLECYLHETLHEKTLQDLLGGDDIILSRNNDRGQQVLVSQLEKKKVVGLYMCGKGYDIPLLDRVYNEWRSRGLEFEIVLVYTPFIGGNTLEVVREVIGSFLENRNIGWLVLPFSYMVVKRLFNLVDCPISDKLLIVSDGKLVEPDGEQLLRALGCNAYPFDKQCIIQRAVDEIKGHTLESLLSCGSLCHANNRSVEVPLTLLHGCNVLLCLERKRIDICLIQKHYDEIKNKHRDFEFIFVSPNVTVSPAIDDLMLSKPWLVFYPEPSNSEFVVNALTIWGMEPGPVLVSFGDDGRICSLKADRDLQKYGPDAFPFSGDLYKQIDFNLSCLLAL